jgi:hypothetical protein
VTKVLLGGFFDFNCTVLEDFTVLRLKLFAGVTFALRRPATPKAANKIIFS